MKKLIKSYEASSEQHIVKINGQVYKIANLKKSGITLKNTIIIGQDDKWDEIELSGLGVSNNLTEFKQLIVEGKITPAQLNIYVENNTVVNYNLTHSDFEKLENLFPKYPYFMISKLFRYLSSKGRKSNYEDLRDFMKRVNESQKTIPEWIMDNENDATFFVEGVKPEGPFETKFKDGDISFTYWISKNGGTIKYYSVLNDTKESIADPGAEYKTVKQAEKKCLSKALVCIKSLILNRDSPEKYYELFRLIQNKFKTINMSEKNKDRENQLTALGMMYTPAEDSYTGHGFTVTGNSIENDSDEDWQNTLERIGSVNTTQPNETPAAPQQGGSTEARVKQLIDLGLKFDGDRTFNLTVKNGFFAVDILDAQTHSDRKWTGLIIEIERLKSGELPTTNVVPYPVPETMADAVVDAEWIDPNSTIKLSADDKIKIDQPLNKKQLVSLASIGNLTEEGILDLQGLKDKQLAVLEANPFIKVTNATTLKKAKSSVTALRKASTGTEKIETDASKFLNTLKGIIKTVVGSNAKLTRDALDKQEQEVKEYENAEALRVAAEQRAKAEKIKKRTDSLFAVPMVFNGTTYNIGTLYIMPSQVEEATDEQFTVLLMQATEIKKQQDEESTAEKSKLDELEQAKRTIARLTGQPYTPPGGTPVMPAPPVPVSPSETVVINKAQQPGPTDVFSAHVNIPAPATETAPAGTTQAQGYMYNTEYIRATPQNYLLARFDMENMHAVNANPIPPAFIKGRALYDRGMKELATVITEVLKAPNDPENPKSKQIFEICEIILEQK